MNVTKTSVRTARVSLDKLYQGLPESKRSYFGAYYNDVAALLEEVAKDAPESPPSDEENE